MPMGRMNNVKGWWMSCMVLGLQGATSPVSGLHVEVQNSAEKIVAEKKSLFPDISFRRMGLVDRTTAPSLGRLSGWDLDRYPPALFPCCWVASTGKASGMRARLGPQQRRRPSFHVAVESAEAAIEQESDLAEV
eukprot:1377930-Amorphochlora_amoeboformis.AAC.2